jgi:hypothetical protein
MEKKRYRGNFPSVSKNIVTGIKQTFLSSKSFLLGFTLAIVFLTFQVYFLYKIFNMYMDLQNIKHNY